MSACTAAISKRIILEQGYTAVTCAFCALLGQSPGKADELLIDDSGEILDEHLMCSVEQLHPTVGVSQSAPGCLVDNRLVEQESDTLVRSRVVDRR